MSGIRAIKLSVIAGLIPALLLISGCSYSLQQDTGLSAGMLVSGSLELSSSRHTKPEPASEEIPGLSLDGFEKKLENERFELYFRGETGAIRLKDKRSGYVWGSIAEDKPFNLNRTWSAIANSVIAIDVYDVNGALKTLGAGKDGLILSVHGNRIEAKVHWPEQQIELKFEMELTAEGLRLRLDDESIREIGEFSLGAVYFLPFFGSTIGDEKQGYIFVPDGCGALIRFTKPRGYLQGFSKRVYGNDFGIDSLSAIEDLGANRVNAFAMDEETVSLPVFGVVHGTKQNAFLAVIEQGESYAEIQANPAGITTDYNRVTARFVYRQKYEQPVSKAGAGVQVLQKNRNEVNPVISYCFLTGENADYVGMAKAYRRYLVDKGILEKQQPKDGDIALRLDFLAADIKKEFIGTSVLKITGIDEIEQLVRKLHDMGITNLEVSLSGWQDGGLNGHRKTRISTDTVYGGISSLGDLKQLVGPDGKLSLYLSPFTALKEQLDLRSEAAITVSQNVVKIKTDDESYPYLYFVKTSKALDTLENQVSAMAAAGYANWVLDDVGYLLYGEYLQNKTISREEARLLVQQAVADLACRYGRLEIVRPNQYLLEYTDAYLSAPIVSSQLLFETDTVPFLQIVLSGYITMYAPYTNLSLYSRADILRQIDYNMLPSFLLTGKTNYELKRTASAHIQSSWIEHWDEYIVEVYEMMNEIMSKIKGQAFVDRIVLETGLVKNIYESGTVYINYNSTDKQADGLSIPAMSAIYAEGRK